MITNVIRWTLTAALIGWAGYGQSWGLVIALICLFVRAEIADAFALKSLRAQAERDELLEEFVVANGRFTEAVTKSLEQQMRSLDRQELIANLRACARSVTKH